MSLLPVHAGDRRGIAAGRPSREPERADKPKLDDAHQILADEKARRDAIFEQSVQSEKTRGDALSKRFEEALRQAKEEPVSKPQRDFDLD